MEEESLRIQRKGGGKAWQRDWQTSDKVDSLATVGGVETGAVSSSVVAEVQGDDSLISPVVAEVIDLSSCLGRTCVAGTMTPGVNRRSGDRAEDDEAS